MGFLNKLLAGVMMLMMVTMMLMMVMMMIMMMMMMMVVVKVSVLSGSCYLSCAHSPRFEPGTLLSLLGRLVVRRGE